MPNIGRTPACGPGPRWYDTVLRAAAVPAATPRVRRAVDGHPASCRQSDVSHPGMTPAPLVCRVFDRSGPVVGFRHPHERGVPYRIHGVPIGTVCRAESGYLEVCRISGPPGRSSAGSGVTVAGSGAATFTPARRSPRSVRNTPAWNSSRSPTESDGPDPVSNTSAGPGCPGLHDEGRECAACWMLPRPRSPAAEMPTPKRRSERIRGRPRVW